MDDAPRFSDPVWDHFFQFICTDVDSLSAADVADRLKELRIDTEKQKSRIHQALDCQRARAQLASFKSKRLSLVKRAKAATLSSAASLRSNIRVLISETFRGSAQTAYFRKLDSTATDRDLVSLLDDLHFLDDVVRDSTDVGPEGK